MMDKKLVYERNVTTPRSWTKFSTGHVAFGLHRLTGWILLGWVVVHLGFPAVFSSPTAVYRPTATPVIVGLVSVALFHVLNGVRLLVAELTSHGIETAKRTFQVTLLISVILSIVLGVLL